MTREAYIGAGSDTGDRLAHLQAGLAGLARAGLEPAAVSSVWETEGVGTPRPSRFLNLALCVRTSLAPPLLLERLLAIERAAGRVRGERNGPRTLDLDLLLVDGLVLDEPGLSLPHPRMWERGFVLAPLCEIAPHVRNPLTGRTVREELARLSDRSRLRRLDVLAGVGSPSPSRLIHESHG